MVIQQVMLTCTFFRYEALKKLALNYGIRALEGCRSDQKVWNTTQINKKFSFDPEPFREIWKKSN